MRISDWSSDVCSSDLTLQDELRASPDGLGNAVEEFLRMYAIATPMRTATRDMIFHGAEIRKGDQFVLMVAAINYDHEAFAEPDLFRTYRSERTVALIEIGRESCRERECQ